MRRPLPKGVPYYASLGIIIECVMTDNDSCYRSFAFGKACKRLGLQTLYAEDQRQG